jgi:hypothetical protein
MPMSLDSCLIALSIARTASLGPASSPGSRQPMAWPMSTNSSGQAWAMEWAGEAGLWLWGACGRRGHRK